MQLYKSGAPMERIATDILGELPITDRGNRYISVVSDYYSKWTEGFPMKNMEAETVAKIIEEQVLTRLGVPYAIHSDQETQFESRLFVEVCKLFGIEKSRTTPYHPKSDGMVGRFNKTLATMLSAYVDEHQKD
jgi:transposase InsO family protein